MRQYTPPDVAMGRNDDGGLSPVTPHGAYRRRTSQMRGAHEASCVTGPDG
ncbi:hypothetical protein [Lysobacter gummosus]